MWSEEEREQEYARIRAYLERKGPPPCNFMLGYRNLGVETPNPCLDTLRGYSTTILISLSCKMFPLYGDFILDVLSTNGCSLEWVLGPMGWNIWFWDGTQCQAPPIVASDYSRGYKRILECRLYEAIDDLHRRGAPLAILFLSVRRGIIIFNSLPGEQAPRLVDGLLFDRLLDRLLYDTEPFEKEISVPYI